MKNESVEMIGKNCKHTYWSFTNFYLCRINKYKKCGMNNTCDCFNDKGMLMFERRVSNEKAKNN